MEGSDLSHGESEVSGEENDAPQSGNAAWAEVMAKIMNKQGPKDATSLILTKNKDRIEENKQERLEQRERKKQLNKKRKWEQMNYVKPNALDKEYERSLQKIATRGVVQLFNAVKKHQKQLEEKLKSAKTEGKKDQVMKSVSKGEFLDMLKGDAMSKKNAVGGAPESNAMPRMKKRNEGNDAFEDVKPDKASWDVLRDDFMMGNKLKDWDKQSDEEE